MLFQILIDTIVYSQTPSKMIESSIVLPTSLSAIEKTQFDRISTSKFVQQTNLIEIHDLATSIQNGSIVVSFPITSCGNLTYKTIYAEYESQDEYRWEGELIPPDTCQCADGYLVIVAHEGRIFGHLALDGDFYEIQEISSNTHTFSKVSFYDFDGEECGTLPSSGFANPTVDDRSGVHCEVRILVLYNQSTIVAEGHINAVKDRIYLAMAQTNIALNNSAVTDNELRLVIAGIDSIPGYQQTSVIADEEFKALRSAPFVTNKRDALGADIVVFLTGDDYMNYGSGGDTIDIFGSSGTLTLNDTFAYVIVETGTSTTSRYTFAHEIAHIFGCRYNFSSDNTPGIMHAYKFKTACREKHTIMHVVSDTTPRILHYSNPNVTYAGKSTGTNYREYNAEQLRSTSCIVAAFRETNNNPLSAHIGGNRVGCPCDVVTLFAELTGGIPGSYSYEWTISLDGGITYGTVQDTSSQFQTELPCPNEGSYRVRLKVTAPNGQIVFTFATIRATLDLPSGDPCGHGGHRPSDRTNILSSDFLRAIPNPASEWVQISFPSRIGEDLVISIFAATGKTPILEKTISSKYGIGSVDLPVGNWENGLYFCTASGNGFSQTIKFVIIK